MASPGRSRLNTITVKTKTLKMGAGHINPTKLHLGSGIGGTCRYYVGHIYIEHLKQFEFSSFRRIVIHAGESCVLFFGFFGAKKTVFHIYNMKLKKFPEYPGC